MCEGKKKDIIVQLWVPIYILKTKKRNINHFGSRFSNAGARPVETGKSGCVPWKGSGPKIMMQQLAGRRNRHEHTRAGYLSLTSEFWAGDGKKDTKRTNPGLGSH